MAVKRINQLVTTQCPKKVFLNSNQSTEESSRFVDDFRNTWIVLSLEKYHNSLVIPNYRNKLKYLPKINK
jgi:hypothetical protein